MRNHILASLVLISVMCVSAVAIPSVAFSVSGSPMVRSSNGESINWSGYAVSTSNVTSVSADFTVPTVSGPGSVDGLPTDVSVWVGIDGYTSNTVEQTGISGSYDSTTGTASYYAWWEMFPRGSNTIRSMSINAGDAISASVVYNGGGRFTLSITDTTDEQSFSITAHAPTGGPNLAQRNSAEWVVERAATIYKGFLTFLPLATFTTAPVFSSVSFTTGSGSPITLQTAVSTYTQYSGSPATPPAQPYWEQMYMGGFDSSGNTIQLDSTSSVTSNSFSVSFLNNGVPSSYPNVYRHSPP